MFAELGEEIEEPVNAMFQAQNDAYFEVDKQVVAAVQRRHVIVLSAIALTAIIMAIVSILIARSITRPVGRMTSAMTALAGGEKATAVPDQDYSNEIGKMSHALETFKNAIIESERLSEEQAALQRQAAEEKARVAEEQAMLQKLASDEQAKAAAEREQVAKEQAEAQAVQAARAEKLLKLTQDFDAHVKQ